MVLLVDQLRELQWEKHIDDLWQEVLSKMEYPAKKSRRTLADGDKPSTRGQFGGGGSSDSCDILTNPYTFEREIQGPLRKIGSATLHSKLN